MAQEQMDVKRPRQKVKREIRRTPIALDDYLFERKMQSLYYGKKPKSDDTPGLFKFIKRTSTSVVRGLRQAPKYLRSKARALGAILKKYPQYAIAGTLVACFLTLFIVARVTSHHGKTGSTAKDGAKTDTSAASQPVQTSRIPLNQTPDFSVVLPQGKTIQDFGGWAKVSPPSAPATYAYKDKIGNVDLLVSEQLLPDTFKTDTHNQVEKLAIGFNANQSVKTEKVDFFVGSNSDGEQSVITYTPTLLIFLKSSAKISNARWQTYIEDLK